jgi:uncharacterized membrane protein YidH (DUF202 family)
MVDAFQSVTVTIFVVNFLLGAYLHEVYASVGVFALIYFSTFFASDFSFAPPNVDIYFHVWSLALALVSAFAGYYYAIAMKVAPLVSLQTGGKGMTKFNAGTIAAQLHVVAVATVTFGINAWLRRTQVVSGGLYPLGVDLVKPAIAATCVGIAALVITTIMMATSKYDEFKRSAKYIWMLPLVPATMVINDIGAFDWKYQIGTFIAFVAMWVVVWAMAVYLPSTSQPEEYDFYRKKKYATFFFGFMGLITFLGLLLIFAVAVWPTAGVSLQTGMIIMMSYAGAVWIGSIFASMAISKETVETWNVSSQFHPLDIAGAGAFMTVSQGSKSKQISLKDRFSS